MARSEQSNNWSWTQPLCADCWPDFINQPGRQPVVVEGPDETCCHCKAPTAAGIYVRVDPHGGYCRYPTNVKD